MNAVTEKDYPIENKWMFKYFPPYLLIGFLFFLINSTQSLSIGGGISIFEEFGNILFWLIIACFSCIGVYLRKKNFHYFIEDKFMVLHQGIISKQQRNIPYGVIQNVLVKQDLLDRIFGLATLSIENASSAGGGNKVFGMVVSQGTKQGKFDLVGFSGNLVSIPGLTKQNAEILKNIVLQRMKENPIEDSQSGL